MQVAAPETRRSTGRRRAIISAFAVAIIAVGLLVAAPYLLSGSSSHPQATCTMPNGAAGTFDAVSSSCIDFTVVITHQEQSFVNLKLLQEGFSANCWAFCHGIAYTLDPTVITNDGHDFEQCKIFGSSGTITCTPADTATVVGLSENSGTPAAGDTYASGPCSSTNLITTGGLADVAGSVSPGTAGSTVTTTIAHTFTAAETDSAVQTACLLTETNSGSDVVVYAEGTFGPDSLVSGNTLAITWSIART